MTQQTPLITVAMITYNHSEYISQAIESILQQSFKDWELVIINDGSTDSTAQIASSFEDSRIRVISQENQGPSIAANNSMRAARGKYISLHSGDDICQADRLEKQLERYEEGPRRLLFSACEIIDHNNEPVDESHYLRELFNSEKRSRAEILKKFLLYGNFICGPSCFTELALFQDIGEYDPVLYQLQDYDMWIRAIKSYDIEIMQEKLYSYRVLPEGGNLGSTAPEKLRRSAYEHFLIMQNFFDDVSVEFFIEAFKEKFIKQEDLDPISACYEQAFLLLGANGNRPLNSLVAIEILRDLLNDQDSANLIKERYEFTAASFGKLLLGLDQLEVA